MNRILNKLRSGRGASITFGLLLFLVCAVLSSVTIVAATSAAGRMANLAENDQRYYSVTSACEVLEQLVKGKSVKIVTIDKGSKEGTYIFEGTSVPKLDKLGTRADNSTVFNSMVCDAANVYINGNSDSNKTVTISSIPSDVAPKIEEVISNSNGDIQFSIEKTTKSGTFKMYLTFTASIVTDSVSQTEEAVTAQSGGSSNVIVTTTVKTMNWDLTDKTIG